MLPYYSAKPVNVNGTCVALLNAGRISCRSELRFAFSMAVLNYTVESSGFVQKNKKNKNNVNLRLCDCI